MQAINVALYLLAVLTCLACTVLLWRSYARTRLRLLLWSALCFVGLTASNLLLFFDLVILIEPDLRVWRLAAALAGLAFLLYGFLFESE
jgi:uncharacterized protein DUF5985